MKLAMRVLCLLCVLVLLASCMRGSRQRLDNQFSELQLREIVQTADGLQLSLRLSNFGRKALEIERVEFTLAVEGQAPIRQAKALELKIASWGTEPLNFSVAGAQLGHAGDDGELRYQLTGVISRKGLQGAFQVKHAGVLSPVPGIDGAWR